MLARREEPEPQTAPILAFGEELDLCRFMPNGIKIDKGALFLVKIRPGEKYTVTLPVSLTEAAQWYLAASSVAGPSDSIARALFTHTAAIAMREGGAS